MEFQYWIHHPNFYLFICSSLYEDHDHGMCCSMFLPPTHHPHHLESVSSCSRCCIKAWICLISIHSSPWCWSTIVSCVSNPQHPLPVSFGCINMKRKLGSDTNSRYEKDKVLGNTRYENKDSWIKKIHYQIQLKSTITMQKKSILRQSRNVKLVQLGLKFHPNSIIMK